MFDTIASCHLWDLADEGVADVLDRLRGQAGVAGVSVTLAHPPAAVLRPHRGDWSRVFRSQGGLQFQPNREAYASTRIRPLTADWLRKSNPLAAAAEGCVRLELILRGRIAACHSQVLASRHDFCAAKNVFGDLHPAWLCPVNQDVREYLRALVADLSGSYPFKALEIEAVSFPLPAGTAGLSWGRPACPYLGPTGEWLAGLCFCESCRQAAAGEGVDALAAARSASLVLERALATGEPVPQTIADLAASDEILGEYAAWGRRQVAELIALLRQACKCRLVVLREPLARESLLVPSSDWPVIAAHCDALLAPVTDDTVEPLVQLVAAETGDASKVEIAASACAPECPDSSALVRTLSMAARLGVHTAVVSDYGQLPPARLDWIKQAARYATRESE